MPARVSQTGAASERPRPSSALVGLSRTIVSQPRGSQSMPYSPASKSAYVLPRLASGLWFGNEVA